MSTSLCVDVGSTFTKAVLVDDARAVVVGTASVRTTSDTDVLHGYAAVRQELVPDGEPGRVLVCSSAGGGLRLAVVGHEREVTSRAGHRVGLSAGAKVVHVSSGRLDGPGIRALRASTPDILLLVGGTDGGNADTLLHNAGAVARARVRAPIVLAGNAEAAAQATSLLESAGRWVIVADNVLPRIGVVSPSGARAAIREMFLRHVIGGKGLSRGPAFAAMVRAATPDAMLAGVEVLAHVVEGDVMVLDIGGATTDVYSAITPVGERATLRKDVAGTLWHARTVEGDLGMRWNLDGILVAAAAEGLALDPTTSGYAAELAAGEPGRLPAGTGEWDRELSLATVASLVAARRHGRADTPGGSPRPLHDVRLLLGSGGVLRHAPDDGGLRVLDAVTHDHAGGWRAPAGATVKVDAAYVLFAVGLLAAQDPDLARRLVTGTFGTLG